MSVKSSGWKTQYTCTTRIKKIVTYEALNFYLPPTPIQYSIFLIINLKFYVKRFDKIYSIVQGKQLWTISNLLRWIIN